MCRCKCDYSHKILWLDLTLKGQKGKNMQRTVKSIVLTYAETELVNGNIVAKLNTHRVFNETDIKKAHKKAEKELNIHFNPLSVDIEEDLYILDDEVFFKYAKKAEKTAKAENGEG